MLCAKWAIRKLPLRLFIIAFGVGGLQPVFGGDKGDGGYAGGFLRFGVGARALGMGNAFVAVADDPTSCYWNPAGLTRVGGIGFTTSTILMSLGRRLDYIGLVRPITHLRAIGVGFVNFGLGDIEGRDQYGLPTQKFSFRESALLVSYGFILREGLGVGLTGKLLNSSLANYRAYGAGVDVGLLWKPITSATVGVVAQDVYTYLKWDTPASHGERFPIHFKVAFSNAVLDSALQFSIAYDKNIEQAPGRHLGIEYWFQKTIGFRIGREGNDTVFGLGIIYRTFHFDYGFRPDSMGEGGVHALDVGFRLPGRLIRLSP